MATPHKCPCCDGYGQRLERPQADPNRECVACDGHGIVWDYTNGTGQLMPCIQYPVYRFDYPPPLRDWQCAPPSLYWDKPCACANSGDETT